MQTYEFDVHSASVLLLLIKRENILFLVASWYLYQLSKLNIISMKESLQYKINLMFPAMPGVVDMEKVKQNKINNLRE
jgi:hypothetical protein